MSYVKNGETAYEKVEKVLEIYKKSLKTGHGTGQFTADVIRRANLVGATDDGKVTFEVDMSEEYSNIYGTLHAAASALLLDVFTTITFLSLPPTPSSEGNYGSVLGGVTRNLNLTAIRAVPLPVVLRVSCEVIQHGRTASLVRGNITSADGKTLYVTSEHHKVNLPKHNPGQHGSKL